MLDTKCRCPSAQFQYLAFCVTLSEWSEHHVARAFKTFHGKVMVDDRNAEEGAMPAWFPFPELWVPFVTERPKIQLAAPRTASASLCSHLPGTDCGTLRPSEIRFEIRVPRRRSACEPPPARRRQTRGRPQAPPPPPPRAPESWPARRLPRGARPRQAAARAHARRSAAQARTRQQSPVDAGCGPASRRQ